MSDGIEAVIAHARSLYLTEAPYAIDRDGNVWKVVRASGMLTRADYNGIKSCGIHWAQDNIGPLVGLHPELMVELAEVTR